MTADKANKLYKDALIESCAKKQYRRVWRKLDKLITRACNRGINYIYLKQYNNGLNQSYDIIEELQKLGYAVSTITVCVRRFNANNLQFEYNSEIVYKVSWGED